MTKTIYDVLIIGAGPAGLSAAIYTGRKKLKTILLSVDVGGQGNLTAHIENYPGALPQSGMELIQKFKTQVDKFGTETIYGKVKEVKKEGQNFLAVLGNGEEYRGKAIILAYGKVPRTLNVPGEDKFMGRGVSTCATCDGPLFKNKIVVVIGGGNSAVEGALDLANHANKVYLVHRREEFRADEVTIEKLKKNKKIEIILDSAVSEIKGEKFVQAVEIENLKTKKKSELKLDGIFLEIGYVVDSSMVKDIVKLNQYNEVVVDGVGNTSCKGIFAAGDVTNTPYKQAIIAAGDGARTALQAYHYLTGDTGKLDWH